MNTQTTPADLLKELVSEALTKPNEFAVASANMPAPLLLQVNTLVLVTIIHLTSLLDQRIAHLESFVDDGK